MPDLKIRTYPDPILRKKSKKVSNVTEEETRLINYMAETMYANEGIGLAAPQLGVLKRIIVIDAREGLLKMVNPEINEMSGMSALDEGCLSVPGRQVEVKRPEKITVSFMDENNSRVAKSIEGLTAKAVQHEMDHLDGKLIIDFLPWYKRIFPKRGEVKCLQ